MLYFITVVIVTFTLGYYILSKCRRMFALGIEVKSPQPDEGSARTCSG